MENLLKPENKAQFQVILTCHIVTGKVMDAGVVKLTSAATVNGKTLIIAASEEGVTVDNAKVVKTDIETSNGIIHVTDGVILPEAAKLRLIVF